MLPPFHPWKVRLPFFRSCVCCLERGIFFSETPYSYLPPLHSFLSPHLTSRKRSLMVPSPTWILMLISLYTCRSSVYIFTTRPLLWPPQAQTSVFFFKERITLSLKCVPAVLCYRFQLTTVTDVWTCRRWHFYLWRSVTQKWSNQAIAWLDHFLVTLMVGL